ncbi:hypothetical protein [Ruminococcus albus]|uniref:Uncharacterized protein n=1 Tax=Ruminococcus albus (strain ATCC 27210 / DSM 20455 / JCM 14654 / NCDO 2250 / 7) TaxID=697329 RepID=E6UI48_RUMA7|nr:hypothetical protein [Ruminococcus albus]ADU21301.1 hypothetical protein Rumal_0766 [Ruminococcus albus 7 = DSM 20455]
MAISKERDYKLLEMLSEIENNKVLFYKVDFDISDGDEMMPYIFDAIYQRFIVIAYRLLGNKQTMERLSGNSLKNYTNDYI